MTGTVFARGRALGIACSFLVVSFLTVAFAAGGAAAATTEPSPSQILISELRFAGPGGAHDGYVELYNPGSANVTVTGWKLNYALSGNGGTASVTLPPATVAPAGHLLVADSAYSLGGYAAPDVTTSLGASPTGVQVTSPDGTVIVDAVGQSGAPSGFFSGTPLTPNSSASGHSVAWVRRYSGGAPTNTNNNASDFALIATDAGTMNYGQVAEQGAPGPMSLSSPSWDASLQSLLLDNNPARNSSTCPSGAAAQTCPPNRVVSGRTMLVQRVLTNSGTQTLSVARIRMTMLTTYGSPGASASQAILVPENSSSQTFSTSTGNVAVNGITLDQPPSQPNGGGLNSSLSIPLPNGGLAPGKSIPISIAFNIVQGGTFNFTYNAEAGLGAAPPPAPTVSVSPTSGNPAPANGSGTGLTVSGTNWTPGHTITVDIGGQTVCSLTANGSGNISGTQTANGCQVPQVTAGSQPLTASDNSNGASSAIGSPFTVDPAIDAADFNNSQSSVESPGAEMAVSAAGFAPNSQLTFKLDSTTLTPSGPSTTNGNGVLGYGATTITIPQGTTAGTHTLTVSDASGNSASQKITVYAPTISVMPTLGNPAVGNGAAATGLTVSGGGWPSGDSISVSLGGQGVCTLTANGSGNISGTQAGNGCQVPQAPGGSEPVKAVDSAVPAVQATGSSFTVNAAIHVGDASTPSSTIEVPGGTMGVSAAGFAASSQLTVKFDSTTLTTSGTSKTDSTGTLGWGNLQFTVPASASAGSHTITVTDGSNNSATQSITVNRVAVAVSPTTGNPQPDYGSATGLAVSGGGWTPGDTIVVQIDNATVCQLTADQNGNISGTQAGNSCQVPRVPAGSRALTAYDNANPGVTQTGSPFTVSPAIHAGDVNNEATSAESPGGQMYVSAAGFAASSQLSFKLDSTTLTPSGTSKTDSTGTLGWGNAQITIPAGTSAGTHTLTATDGSGNSATQQITVYAPTVSVTPTTGNPQPDYGSATGLTVSGGGWPAGDTIIVQIGSATVCELTANGSGNISGTQAANGCQVPQVPNGAQSLSASDGSVPTVQATGSSFTVNPAIHVGDASTPSSTIEVPGGTMGVSAAGFAPSSQLTVKFDSTTLTPSGTSKTDSTGTLSWGNLQFTVPASASAGSHTITVTDGSNNSATQKITVNRVAVAVSPTTGNPQPDYGSATGLDVSGGGWTPGDAIVVQIDNATVCDLTANNSGDISGAQSPNGCQVPRVPAGSQALTAYDNSNPNVTQTGSPFTVTPAIHAGDVNNEATSAESPGGKMYVSAAGFAASSQLTFKLDSTTLTPSGTSKTDSTGTLGWGNAQITIPANTTAGAHTLTVSDGTNSATQQITVYAPTVSVVPTSGSPAVANGPAAAALAVSGVGWPVGDNVVVSIGGQAICTLTANGSGNISGTQAANGCHVPQVANGSQALTAYDSSVPPVQTTGPNFTVTPAIHVGDANTPSTTTETPGATMDVSAAGFAANSQLTVKFDSTTLTTSGTSKTDSTGALGWGNLQFTVPSGASNGSHTITVTDASNNSATQTITVNRVAVAVSPTSGNPGPDYGPATGLNVSGGGWTPGDTIVVQIDAQTVCQLTADGGGDISGTQAANGCQVPRVPAGSQALTAYDTASPNATQTGSPFTVSPAIHAGDVNSTSVSTESPGGKMYVSAAGFAASSQLTFKLDSTPLTPSGTSKTDSTGTLGWGNAQITIPAGTTAGSHTLTVSDGTNSATQQITVYAPTVSVAPTAGNPQPDYGSATALTVSGGGWPKGDNVVVEIGNGIVCELTADSNGNISGTQTPNGCQVPQVPNGSQALTAYDNSVPTVQTAGSSFTVNAAIHVGDASTPSSTIEVPGGTMGVSAAGFAASSQLTVKFDSTTLTTSGTSKTDSTGTLGWGNLQFTVPASASAGSHTITVTDASNHSATQSITVNRVAVAVSPTSGNPQPDYGSATGLTVSGGGWTPGDTIVVQIDNATVCDLTANNSGDISGAQAANGCQVPRVPAGSQALTAYDSANPGVTQTGSAFTVSPAIHAGDVNNEATSTESAGGKMYVSAAGFAASSQLTFKLDSTTLTPSGTSKTDSTGTLGWGNAQITIPAGTSAGTHTLTATDGSGNSATQQITVYAPTVSVVPSSGNPAPDYGSATGLTVSGGGWPAGDTIVVQIGSATVCELTANGSGSISGTQAANGCQVPRVPDGKPAVSAYDSSTSTLTATGGTFTINPAIHVGDVNNEATSTESPGGQMYVSAVGFAASSQLTVKFDSTTLTTSGTSTTDSTGTLGWGNLQFTVPASASAGSHTITVTDASNNSATQTITVNRVAVAVSPTSGNPAPDEGSATGLNVSGGGWTPSDYIVVQIDGATVCGLYADSSGDITGTQAANGCQVPRVPAGSQALTAYDTSNPGVTQTGSPFTVSPAIHAGEVNDASSAEESPGGQMYVSAAGFAKNSQLTFTLDSTKTLTPSGTSTTDSTGTLGWGNAQITIPAGTTAGTHTLTATDGSANSATQQITVYTPTVSVAPTSGNPQPDYGSGTTLTVSGTGWPRGDVVPVWIDGDAVCYLTADGSGNISSTAPGSGTCSVPQVPNGRQALTAADDSNPGVTATGSPFTVTAAIHVGDASTPTTTTEIPGGKMDVSAAGFAPNSQLTVKFDSTTLTPSGTSTTGSTGTLGWGNLQFTVPENASAGSHTITVTDASGNSATQTITVNRVAVAVAPTSGNPEPDYGSATGLTVSGGGWTPNDNIVVEIGGQTVCELTADQNGNISGTQAANSCQVPRVPAGSQALTAYDTASPNVTQTGSSFTVSPAIHAGDVNNEASSTESPGGKMYVSGAGFAKNSQLTFTLDSTKTLTPSGSSTTDSTGTLGWGNAQLTIPAGTSAGTHTITATDGSGNSATEQITVYAPTLSVSPSSGNPQPDYGSATGLTVSGGGWPAGDTIIVLIGNAGVCDLTASGSGSISGTQAAESCQVPRVPNGTPTVSAYDSASPSVTATDGTFTINPAIHEGDPNNPYSSTEAPGATVDISGAGFAANSNLTFKFDGNSLASTPASPSTGSDGSFGWGSVQVTIPSGASAGQHTITATDAAGNSTKATVTVQLVAVAVSPTSGSPVPDYGPTTGLDVSGAGWTPNDTIVVEIGGQYVCQLRADSDGTISGTESLNNCEVPRVAAGSQTLSAYDSANPGVTQTGSPFTVVPAIHAADTSNVNSTEVSPGGSMYVSGAGFAAGTPVTVSLDGNPLTTNPTSPSTQSNGTLYWGEAEITIPASTSAGTYTITVSDGTNSATQQITVYAPTISVTPTSGTPSPDYGSGTGLNVSGSGWPAGDYVSVEIGGQTFCSIYADGSGNLSGSPAAGDCQVPRTPAGGDTLSAYDTANQSVAATGTSPFMITPAIHVGEYNDPYGSTFAQGGTGSVSGAGFAASSAVSVYLDGTQLTTQPASPTTDGNGTMYWGGAEITIPAGESTGTHTITMKDAAGNSASQTITVEQVAVSVTPTTGSPAPDYGSGTGLDVLGNGWTPNDQITVQIDGQTVCTLSADASGNISGSAASNNCTVPRAPAGTEALSAYDDSNPSVTQTGSPFTIAPAIHAGDAGNADSYGEVPGGSMYVSGTGFGADKAITFTFDGNPVASTPANPTTDSYGTMYWGEAEITVPSGTAPGTHTIVASDGTNVASTTVTVYNPTISVSPTSGNPTPDYGSGTGLTVSGSGWPAGDYIYAEVGGDVICGIYADASGNLSGNPANCQVPRETAGSQAVTGYDTGQPDLQATGSSFTVTQILHAGDPSDPYTTNDEAPGATIDLTGAGFAGGSALTFTFDGSSLSSTPATPSTDSSGTFGWGSVQVTIPAGATTGQHTIIATDGSGNHASVTVEVEQPAVAVSPTTGHPSPDYGSATGLNVSGGGWTPGDYIEVQIDGQGVCELAANSSGSISGSQQQNGCQVPRVPYGSQALTAYDADTNGTPKTGAAFSVTPAIRTGDPSNASSTAESPGAKVYVSGVGFAANSNLTFTFDGAPMTSTGSGTTTDSTGYLYMFSNQLTIPANATAGQHTITATDGSNHSASETIMVYKPTVALTPMSGHPAPDYGTGTGVTVSGSGWPAYDTVYVQIDGQSMCSVTASGSGTLSASGSSCSVPRVPAGNQTVSAYASSDPGVTASDGTFKVQPAIRAGDVNNVNSQVVSPGAQMDVGGVGFAANSGVTFTFDGSPMTSNPATPETDSNGYLYVFSNQLTIPANATSGQHTIKATDGAGNSATQTITVYAPTVAVTPSTGNPAPNYGTATGLNVSGSGWPAGDYVYAQIDGQTVCGLTANASGNISGNQSNNGCGVPQVPYGNQAITAYASQDPSVTISGGTFAVKPAIHIGDENNLNSQEETPGGTMYVSVAGLSASSPLTFTFDGSAMTSNPASQSTDSTGYLYTYSTKLTIPANATAGQHTITVTDGSNHSVSATVDVYAPSLSVTPTIGSPAPDYGTATGLTVSGSGWPAGDYVYVQIDGQTVCGLSANASGNLYGTQSNNGCAVPRVPYGNQAITAYASQDPGVTLSAGTFSVQPVVETRDVNDIYQQGEAPGAKVYVGGAGFTANSPMTFAFDGTTLTPSPSTTTTDSNGYLYTYNSNQLTIPSTATAGLHTITATDGAGHSASETIQIYTPMVSVTPTSGAPGSGLSVSGAGWPAGDYVYVQIGGQTVCGMSVDASGKISGNQPQTGCQVPNVATGSQPLTAYDNSAQDITATGPNFTVN